MADSIDLGEKLEPKFSLKVKQRIDFYLQILDIDQRGKAMEILRRILKEKIEKYSIFNNE